MDRKNPSWNGRHFAPPDFASPTLRSYHKLLWSRSLPSGESFDLSDATRRVYLHHRSERGEFFLSSDAVMQTFINWPKLRPIVSQFSELENEQFMAVTYTIGGMMLFPGNQIGRKRTINQARGCTPSISDRFDLTVECIRRHYLHQSSPLASVLERYSEFFALFDDFDGYVKHFLLDDLVSEGAVKFFTAFDDFRPPALPMDVATYKDFRRRSVEFVQARNHRIEQLKI